MRVAKTRELVLDASSGLLTDPESVKVNISALAFCIAEDRADCETGVRLAVLSLSKHSPHVPVFVYRPDMGTGFAEWLRHFPQVRLIARRPSTARQWNCKPDALLSILREGFSAVVWLDSDMIVTRDCSRLMAELSPDTMAITQEPTNQPNQGSKGRTDAWGLTLGRNIPYTLNSSVLRVTPAHIALLERWRRLLNVPEYVATQTRPLGERPFHMMSDQDVLNALLGSAEFVDIPVHMFRSGCDVIHAGGALGYSLRERMRGIFRTKPIFLHAIAGKPWHLLGDDPGWWHKGFFWWYRRLLQEVSPYVAEARQYRNRLRQPAGWMRPRSALGWLLVVTGFGNVGLRGMPLTLIATLMRLRRAG